MTKKIKWLMLTNYIHKALLDNEDCLRTGLYSWIPVFDGEVKQFTDVDPSTYKDYDIIQVNMAGQDIPIIADVREQLDKDGNPNNTKIVANNDYTIELWTASFDHLSILKREVNHADMIFGTEPNQVGTLQTLLERKVHLIVHPCFVKRLKTLTPKRKLKAISVISHRYDNYNIIPSLAVKNLGKTTRLVGYDSATDKKKHVTTTCYNACHLPVNYMDFTEQLLESELVVDPFTLTSQSRTGWDCAALGIPLVGSDRCYSHQKCFPKTCVPPFNIKAMRDMVKKVLTDDKFRKEVIEYAKNAVEYVSYEKSKEKYLNALKEGSPKVEI